MGSTKVQTIQPAAAPSATSSYGDFVSNYPALVKLQTQYAPELAASDLAVNQQFSPEYAKLQQEIDQMLYPETAGLQENLAAQANAGMNAGLPDWAKQQYESNFNAGLGMNVNAPIGISDRNIGLLQLQEDWKRYYQNMGLSLAGRQPLQQGSTLNTPQLANSIIQGAGQALNYNQGNYASQLAGTYTTSQKSPWGSIAGAGIGLAATGGNPMGAFYGAGAGSMF